MNPKQIRQLKKYKKLLKLVKLWTHYEIMARLGDYKKGLGFADFFAKKNQVEDKIRTLIYGTWNLAEIGIRLKLIKPNDNKKKRRIKPKLKRSG
jgi:hypothetical protein